jgi:hypothetical protein
MMIDWEIQKQIEITIPSITMTLELELFSGMITFAFVSDAIFLMVSPPFPTIK